MSVEGRRPSIPTEWDPVVKDLIKACWQTKPSDRLNFNAICSIMEGLFFPSLHLYFSPLQSAEAKGLNTEAKKDFQSSLSNLPTLHFFC